MDLTMSTVIISRVDTVDDKLARLEREIQRQHQDTTNSAIEEDMLQYMRAKGGLQQVVQDDELLRDVLSFVKQRLSAGADEPTSEPLGHAMPSAGAGAENDVLSDATRTLNDNKELYLRKLEAVKTQLQAQDEERSSKQLQLTDTGVGRQPVSQVCTYHRILPLIIPIPLCSLRLSYHQ